MIKLFVKNLNVIFSLCDTDMNQVHVNIFSDFYVLYTVSLV